MELLFDPGSRNEIGKALPIPSKWKKSISPWATVHYYEYPFGSSLIQQFISKRFSVHIWQIHIDKPGKLYPVCYHPIIALQFTIEGNIPCILAGYGPKLLQRSRYELFYVPKSVNEAQFEPGSYESLHIEIEPGFLEEVITLKTELTELVSRFQLSSVQGMPLASAQINYITVFILQNLKRCNKKDESLQFEMYKYVIELLSEYFTYILENGHSGKLSNLHHQDLLEKMKDHILLSPNIHDHTLEKLARLYQINETSLYQEFKIIFKVTISDFVRHHALNKAYYLLMATERPVDDIGEEVGYSWRPAFEGAFRKQYKVSPFRLRKNKNS